MFALWHSFFHDKSETSDEVFLLTSLPIGVGLIHPSFLPMLQLQNMRTEVLL